MRRQAMKRRVERREALGASSALRTYSTSALRLAPRGLTLIELLVTIVIMVAVLAGVIPLMSPNNNARKIREASRQLSSLLSQAQAQAARDGRPAGVAFREFVTGTTRNGVALEAFMIAQPRPFAGFSDNSQVRILFQDGAANQVQFIIAGQFAEDPAINPNECYPPDPVPPNSIRFGDVISVGGFELAISDPDRDGQDPKDDTEEDPPFIRGDYYTDSRAQFVCTYIGDSMLMPRAAVKSRASDQLPISGWSNPMAYRILRQPTNTSDAPLQFPRGIGIDLQASGATGPWGNFDDGGVADVVGIMFNPNGTVEGLYFNGARFENLPQIFMLLGIVENANNGTQDDMDYNFKDSPKLDADNLAQRRSRINWLNADSRWVTVNRAGRVVATANNTSFDPSQSPYIDDLTGADERQRAEEQRQRQLNGYNGQPGARQYAAEMQQEGGR